MTIRLILAIIVSTIILFVYDILVLKPITKKKKEIKREEIVREKIESEEEIESREKIKIEEKIYPQQNFSISKIYSDEFLSISVFGLGVKTLEFKKFLLHPNSPEKYKLNLPLEIYFKVNDKIERIKEFKEEDGKIFAFGDTVSSSFSLEISRYLGKIDINVFGDSITSLSIGFILRKSMPDDSQIIVGDKKFRKIEDVNLLRAKSFGEESRYFLFVLSGIDFYVFNFGNFLVFETPPTIFVKKIDFSFKFFAGPKDPEELKMVGFEKFFGGGMLFPIEMIFLKSLKFINEYVKNWGFSIIILSIIIRLVFTPLMIFSYRSMKKLKELQPKIQELKEKYKNKEELSKEIFALYQREKINPFLGCLPLMIQLPIFIALYRALSSSIELRFSPFILWIKDLSSPETIFTLNFAGFSLPIRLLPILMGGTFLIQQILTPQTSDDPTLKYFNYFMPILFTILLWNIPSGLHLYWITMNVLGMIHQFLVLKK